jgi:hypothetical protein
MDENGFGDGISAEDIWDYDEVACSGEVVCKAVWRRLETCLVFEG